MTSWSKFYEAPPQRAIELDELEQAALLRLRVLCVLVAAPSTDQFFRTAQDLPPATREALELLDVDTDLDAVAHYALRLAFCTSHGTIGGRDSDRYRLEWLVNAETRLMTFRLRIRPTQHVLRILKAHVGHYRMYTREEASICCSARGSEWIRQVYPSADAHFFRVPFQEAARLVGRRHVLLDRGYCWLPVAHLYVVVANSFTTSLRTQLTALHRSLPAKRREMERLHDVIDRIYAESMIRQQLPIQLASRRRQALVVTPHNIDAVAEKHFPLCMKHLHRKLRENHHLKFDGRVQYRVFLKGLGFSVHDSILFFRNEFTRVIPPSKFDREYVYHIRHSYGLEGSRKDYAPMDCQKIILGGAPRHGQYHGCPFKHWDVTSLESELQRTGVGPREADGIARTASHGHPERACVALFETLHHRPYRSIDPTIGDVASLQMHPNQWVHASMDSQDA